MFFGVLGRAPAAHALASCSALASAERDAAQQQAARHSPCVPRGVQHLLGVKGAATLI
jgi:hypothetical protein